MPVVATPAAAAAPAALPPRRRRVQLSIALAAVAAVTAARVFCQAAFTGAALPLMPALRRASAAAAPSSLPRRVEEGDAEVDPEEEAEQQRLAEIKAQRAADAAWRIGLNLDGDKLDNLQEWYEEALAGPGGIPKPKGQQGFLRDLILRSFFGNFNDQGRLIPDCASRAYTGEKGRPCATDFETAYENLKRNVREGVIIGRDDGEGWTWLVASQNPGGLSLYLSREPPFGERPLALIKTSDPDEFFSKVDWNRLFIRLHKWQLWGGAARRFPYPLGRQRQSAFR